MGKFLKIGCGGLLALVVIIVVVAAMSSGNKTATNSSPVGAPTALLQRPIDTTPAATSGARSTGTAAPKPSTVPAASTATPEPPKPIVFDGKGAKVTPEFTVRKGVLVFEMQSDGGQFAVKMFDKQSSENPSTVVDVKKAFKGSAIWSVNDAALSLLMKSGKYTLGVEATGNWKITVSQPIFDKGQTVPVSFAGQGTLVTAPFTLAEGPRIFKFTAKTSGFLDNFMVHLVKTDGTKEDSIANELPTSSKPTEGSKIVGVKANEAGIYVLGVKGDTDWTVSVE